MLTHDLNDPEFNPPDCPDWAKETLPAHIQPFRGRNGMPSPYRERDYPLGREVRGLDRYQANQFITYRPETAKYLYEEYTPLRVNYRRGLLPTCEALAAEVTAGCRTETEKMLALLTKGASRVKHPAVPPCGAFVPGDRNLDDETLLKRGLGWCNEQARVFIRLCQINGIPARICHTHYSDTTTGHCIAECYVAGRWRMADASWFCVFPGPDEQLLSAAQCHDGGAGQQHCGLAYYRRMQELLKLSDADLNFASQQAAAEWRQSVAGQTADDFARKMHCFSLINYPLPR